MKKDLAHKFIGDRRFYRRALTVALPIMLQNTVTNFVNLLDNIMVGQTGTASMSGVAVVGQLFFIFNLIIFGTVSGPGIFCAQFWGAGQEKSFKAAFRYKLATSMIMCLVYMGVLCLAGRTLIGLYITGGAEETAQVAAYAEGYLRVMLWGMIPYAVAMAYATTLREAGHAVVPMVASWSAVGVNLALNWVLIFGHLGAPAMGVQGAALATVISRFVELGVCVIWSHRHKDQVLFTRHMLEGAPMPRALLADMFRRSMPLLANEALWCLGTATLTQIYSTRGITVMAAMSIALVLFDVFTAVAFSVGSTIGILVGQELGAGLTEQAVDTDRKLLALGVALSAVIALVMAGASWIFPRFYNTTGEVRSLAAALIRIMAAVLPLDCFANGSYFTMRSGGKTLVTFLFDSCFAWVVNVPVAWVLAHCTDLGILAVYTLSVSTVIIKCVIGGVLVHRRYWVNTLSGVETAMEQGVTKP